MSTHTCLRLSLCGLLLLGHSVATAALPTESLEAQGDLFLQAESHLRKGALKSYQGLREQLQDYPLVGYLDYEYLRSRLSADNTAQIDQFLKDNADSPVSDQLRRLWLNRLVANKQWPEYLKYFADLNSTTHDCYRVHALIETQQIDAAMKEIPALWLSGRSQPDACDRVFSEWEKRGHLNEDLVWARIRLAMEKRQLSLAEYLGKKLDKPSQQWVALWLQMHRHPANTLKDSKLNKDQPVTREIVLYGIHRLARLNAAEALNVWQQLQNNYQFTPVERAETQRFIALRSAYQLLPQAYTLLSQVDSMSIDDDVIEWRIRSAIKNADWKAILDSIKLLDAEKRNMDRWRYWEARALSQLGYTQQAEQIFSQLSENTSYYGFLSAESLQVPYRIKQEQIPHSNAELEAMHKVPAVQRASELYRLDRVVSARREWNRMIKTLDERQLELAGVIAHQWGWHDRAIFTVGRTSHRSDLSLRYPIVFKQQVMQHAKQENIAPAWVFSVLRQESAYMTDARSSAGAMGLMQLMPATARSTAKSLKMAFTPHSDLLNASKNIRLGTAHLKQVYNQHDGHFVLATASYNAGSYRVKTWLPEDGSITAAAWIESMPFKETRNYVKNILMTTPIFETHLSTPVTPLSKHMQEIRSRASH